MTALSALLSKWPLIRQIRERADGTGPEAAFTPRRETMLLIWLSFDKQGVADGAIHEHGSGWLIRIGEILNGPLALVLRSSPSFHSRQFRFCSARWLVASVGLQSEKFPAPIRNLSSPRNVRSNSLIATIARRGLLFRQSHIHS
jgi:hypothetical protein